MERMTHDPGADEGARRRGPLGLRPVQLRTLGGYAAITALAAAGSALVVASLMPRPLDPADVTLADVVDTIERAARAIAGGDAERFERWTTPRFQAELQEMLRESSRRYPGDLRTAATYVTDPDGEPAARADGRRVDTRRTVLDWKVRGDRVVAVFPTETDLQRRARERVGRRDDLVGVRGYVLVWNGSRLLLDRQVHVRLGHWRSRFAGPGDERPEPRGVDELGARVLEQLLGEQGG